MADIIEISLDYLTDHKKFENLASDIMYIEGFSNLKPLGGVGDKGRDAILESYYYAEGRTKIVFQYTLQEQIAGKIEETINKLSTKGIEYNELIIVTPHSISSQTQDALKQRIRKKYEITLHIFERKTIANRLSDYSNGLFHRYFPDIDKQIAEFKISRNLLTNASVDSTEYCMLKASIAFTFNKEVPRARKSILDFLILGLLLDNHTQGKSIDQLQVNCNSILKDKNIQQDQINASLTRLESQGYVDHSKSKIFPTRKAIQTTIGTTIQSDEEINSFISDLINEINHITEKELSDEELRKIVRNTKDVLIQIFRLLNIELADKLRPPRPSFSIHIDATDSLISAAKKDLPSDLGEILISAISQALKMPSEEQAQMLKNWALTYLGAEIMNLDPVLNEFQRTRFADKIFVLDTDFILCCLIQDNPKNSIYLKLILRLKNLGCRILIPISCLNECITHAKISQIIYNKYYQQKLLSLNKIYIDEKVGNVFIQGYYYAYKTKRIAPNTSFSDYINNYYEPTFPIEFLKAVIKDTFPADIEINDLSTILDVSIPESQLIALNKELLTRIIQSRKSEYRTDQENKDLAENDAKLFLTVFYANSKFGITRNNILGAQTYLIGSSGRFMQCAKNIGITDIITTRPQTLLGLLELIGDIDLTQMEFISLFENPLLAYAVQQSWDDVEKLVNTGVTLEGKSLTRLRWDMSKVFHDKIITVTIADEKEDSSEEVVNLNAGDTEFINLLKTAVSRGYRTIPELSVFLNLLDKNRAELQIKEDEFNELLEKHKDLEKLITHFSKRKQRYLRKVAKWQKHS